MFKFIKKYLFALLWAMFTLFVCGVNGNNIPEFGFVPIEMRWDKVAHFILFGIQAWLIVLADHKNQKQLIWKELGKAIFLGALFGVLIEILQAYIFINRSFDYGDMLADGVGAVFVAIPAYLKFR